MVCGPVRHTQKTRIFTRSWNEAPEIGGEMRATPPGEGDSTSASMVPAQVGSSATDTSDDLLSAEQKDIPQVNAEQPNGTEQPLNEGGTSSSQPSVSAESARKQTSATANRSPATTTGNERTRTLAQETRSRRSSLQARSPHEIPTPIHEGSSANKFGPTTSRSQSSSTTGARSKTAEFLGGHTKLTKGKDSWTKWLWFGVFVALAGALILATAPTPFSSLSLTLLQGIAVGGELTMMGIFGHKDLINKAAPGSIDRTAVDRWSLVHHVAGVVMGLFGVPLPFVILLTVVWELFEMSVAGFGDEEINANRITDITLALGGWFIARIAASLL